MIKDMAIQDEAITYPEILRRMEQYLKDPETYDSNHINNNNNIIHIKSAQTNNNYELHCVNCKQKGHNVKDCQDKTCHTCRKTFPTIYLRHKHGKETHSNKRSFTNYNNNNNNNNKYKNNNIDNKVPFQNNNNNNNNNNNKPKTSTENQVKFNNNNNINNNTNDIRTNIASITKEQRTNYRKILSEKEQSDESN